MGDYKPWVLRYMTKLSRTGFTRRFDTEKEAKLYKAKLIRTNKYIDFELWKD